MLLFFPLIIQFLEQIPSDWEPVWKSLKMGKRGTHNSVHSSKRKMLKLLHFLRDFDLSKLKKNRTTHSTLLCFIARELKKCWLRAKIARSVTFAVKIASASTNRPSDQRQRSIGATRTLEQLNHPSFYDFIFIPIPCNAQPMMNHHQHSGRECNNYHIQKTPTQCIHHFIHHPVEMMGG